MKRDLRLRKSTDFRRVRRLGKSYAHPLMVLVAHPNQLDKTRIGVAAGKSVGNAVVRNRAKRLMRSAAQSLYNRIKPGWDLVLIARAPMVNTDLHETRPTMETLLTKANLIKEASQSESAPD